MNQAAGKAAVATVLACLGHDRPERQCGEGAAAAAPIPLPELRDVGFTVVERDGRWYVSPLRTALDSLIQIFQAFEASDLETFRRYFSEFMGLGGGSFEAIPEAVETPLPRT